MSQLTRFLLYMSICLVVWLEVDCHDVDRQPVKGKMEESSPPRIVRTMIKRDLLSRRQRTTEEKAAFRETVIRAQEQKKQLLKEKAARRAADLALLSQNETDALIVEGGCPSDDYFACSEELDAKCIPLNWVCDNMRDCHSGLDEMNCNKTFACAPGNLVCANSLCVDGSFRCNGIDDCGDATDEKGCPEEEKANSWCPDNMYKCVIGPCITKSAVCDDFVDCPEGDDEGGCASHTKTICSTDKFKCETEDNCIPVPWVCDGNEDCPDKSDEVYCNDGERIPERNEYQSFNSGKCKKEEYTCHNGDCIKREFLCDNHPDCQDSSDEGGLCNSCNTMGCEYRCEPNPLFPTCTCPEGKILDGQTMCRDIDECADGTSGCDHFCQNEDGGFECYCAYGYKAGPNGKDCYLEKDDVGHLFVSAGREVRKFPLFPEKELGEVYAPLVGESHHISEHVYGLDYNTRKKILYLALAESGQQNGELHYYDGADHRCLVTGFQGISNVAADWVTGNLYFAVAGTRKSPGLGVCTADGRFCKMIVTGELVHRVRGLTLHPRRRTLYWSDWDSNFPRIETSEMDGSNKRILIKSKLRWPNGLAMDYVREQLYWADADLHMIELYDFQTERRQVVTSRGVHQVNELVVFNDFVIWTDWELQAIVRANLRNVTERIVLHGLPTVPWAIAISHPAFQDLNLPNPCTNSNCSHMCLLSASSEEKYTCACPDNYEMTDTYGKCVLSQEHTVLNSPELCPDEFERRCRDGEDPCMNGGSCILQEKTQCKCPYGFDGNFCEYSTLEDYPSNSPYYGYGQRSRSYGWLVALLIVGTILLILGILVGVYIRKSGLAGGPKPSASTPLTKQSTISFARFRKEQDKEKEKMLQKEPSDLDDVPLNGEEGSVKGKTRRSASATSAPHVESFGNPLYTDVYDETEGVGSANVHKTVLALHHGSSPTSSSPLYYHIVDSDSGIYQGSSPCSSPEGSLAPSIV